MKAIFLTFILSLTVINSFSQFVYKEAYDIEVIKNGQSLTAPFTSGYNTSQFSEIDLNFDGILDLIVYDRSEGQVRPYINLGIKDSVSYQYAPKYAEKFPPLRSWLLTADYNNDGLFDLFDGESGIQLWKNTGNSSVGLRFELIGDLKSLYSSTSTKAVKIATNSPSLPAIYDIDSDGDIDIFSINSNNGETVDYHRNLAVENNDDSFLNFERRNQCWGNFYDDNGTFVLDDCNQIPIGGERNEESQAIELDKIEDLTNEKDLKHGIDAMISAVDIDGNGSTDLIISDFDNYKVKLLLNEDSLPAPYVNSRIFAIHDSFPNYDVPIDVLYPAVFFLDVNNDGKKDMIGCPNILKTSTTFPNTVTPDEIFYYKNISSNQKIKLELQQRDFLIGQTLDFGINAFPVFFDYNKDGLQDLVIGNDGNASKKDTSIIGRLELYKNIGTKKEPKFQLEDSDYLNISALNLDLKLNRPTRNIIPTFGDIDGDGDQDLLLGELNNNIFLFEDTSSLNDDAQFKFHPIPYAGLNIKNFGRSNAPVLYDVNNDGILDLLVSANDTFLTHFLNVGTATKPVFNIQLDSIVFQGNRIFRYYLEDEIDYSFFKIGDSLAVNNGDKLDNNSNIKLFITAINPTDKYFECRNTIQSPPAVDSRYNEFSTDAYINFFDRSWGAFVDQSTIAAPRLFPYRYEDKTQLLIGFASGDVFHYSDISNTPFTKEIFNQIGGQYIPNYGKLAFVNGADINDDGMVDLVVGNQSGGIKILTAQFKVGISESLNQKETVQESNYQLYPNPNQGFLNVSLQKKPKGQLNYSITNAKGAILMIGNLNKEQSIIDLNNLPNGIYFFKIQTLDFTETKKLILRR